MSIFVLGDHRFSTYLEFSTVGKNAQCDVKIGNFYVGMGMGKNVSIFDCRLPDPIKCNVFKSYRNYGFKFMKWSLVHSNDTNDCTMISTLEQIKLKYLNIQISGKYLIENSLLIILLFFIYTNDMVELGHGMHGILH